MKMERLIALLLSLLMLTGPAMAEAALAVVEDEAPATYTVEGRAFPYLEQFSSSEDPEESEMTLYFVNGGDIPYVSLNEYLPFLADIMAEMGKGDIEYKMSIVQDGSFSATRDDNGSGMYIDTDENTILFINMNGFTQKVGSRAAVSIKDLPETDPIDIEQLAKTTLASQKQLDGEDVSPTDTGAGASEDGEEEANTDDIPTEEENEALAADSNGAAGEKQLFTMAGMSGYYHNRLGDVVHFNMNDYLIDLVAVDDTCYMPFQTMNDLFMNREYLQFVFTGEKVLGFAYQGELANERFAAEPRAFSDDFALFNYNELRFLMDNFYGLKPEHNISDFGTLMVLDTDLGLDLAGTDPRKFDLALMVLLGRYLDDGHSGYLGGSVLAGEIDEELDQYTRGLAFGPSSRASYQEGQKFTNARKAVYRAWVPGYEEVGDTAFVTFDEFDQEREDEAYYDKKVDLDNPKDTIELIMYANGQIKREGSPIKNIVLDLSCNPGGMASAAVFVLSWFLGDASVALRDTLTGAQTNVAYHCDVDRDGVYDAQRDTVSVGYNLYCLTSVNSFSCGNLVPAACKESGKVTMVGQTSGGGSCVVLPCTTASGALFQMSGTSQLSVIKNGSFYNIDTGVEPDVVLTKAESFYDRPALVEYLKAVK